MQLSQQQLEEIKQFVLRKGFVYLDVQMEIIDHVASAIEERMEADSKLDFSRALQETYSNFGILGFSTIADAVTNGLNKKYNRFFWRTFRSFFSYKYAFLLVLGGLLAYQAQLLLIDNGWWLVVFTVTMLLEIVITFIRKFSSEKLGQYLSFRLSGAYFALQGAFLFVVLLSKPYIEFVDSFSGLYLTIAILSLFLVLYIVYLLAAYKTMNFGRAESRELMKKHRYLNE
ncbi:hypothetical protein QG516_00485 [Pedobacter gandavensis]|uniref:hypothetical protein n=1 Tax=Pedobacter gandavensis TaxID=2679963 RepID=UPI002479B604|nr:hypothetical protein [Pedobacter gandavensis]WGQ10130.1 hypothetical protein QG516_00485 [Pedobacter gandavensis]